MYFKESQGSPTLDIVIRGRGNVSQVLENVKPEEVLINSNADFEVELPQYLSLVTLQRMPKQSINKLRNIGFPGQLLPVTIRGKTYYLDAGYRSNRQLLKQVGIVA